MSEPTALELAKHVAARIVGLQAHPATGHLLDPDMHAQLKLAREVIRLTEREARLRQALGQVLWMTGGAADWEQMRRIRDHVADTLDPPVESRTTPEPEVTP